MARRVASFGQVDAVLANSRAIPDRAPLAALRPAIDRSFAGDTIEDILAALAAEAAYGRRRCRLGGAKPAPA